MPHGIDPAMKSVETTGTKCVLDRGSAQPDSQQLSVRDHAVLALRKATYQPMWLLVRAYIAHRSNHVGHGADVDG
jgi:hypothetical protein